MIRPSAYEITVSRIVETLRTMQKRNIHQKDERI